MQINQLKSKLVECSSSGYNQSNSAYNQINSQKNNEILSLRSEQDNLQ